MGDGAGGTDLQPSPGPGARSSAPDRTHPRHALRPPLVLVRHIFGRAFGGVRGESIDLAWQLRRHLRVILVYGIALLLGAVLFAWSGIYSVAATTGHYPFFRVFLAFALRQSVETHVMGIRVPPLPPSVGALRAAGHYQGGCAPCHGAPDQARNPIARRMLPEPPYLPNVVAGWTDAELFWIVQNGIKYAGMPAWVAPRREDEVWAMVAFLRGLPDMTSATYRALAFGPIGELTEGAAEGVRTLLANGPAGAGIAACARCHGFDGLGRGDGAIPRIAGLPAAYMLEALRNYAMGVRPSGIMQPVAAELDEAEMRAVVGHYAAQPAPAEGPAVAAEPAVLALGRRIAEEGLPAERVAACSGCHGPKRGPLARLYPPLAGQHAEYIAIQLRLWQRGVRGTRHEGALSRIMAMAVGLHIDEAGQLRREGSMTEEQIRAVALYYAALPPAAAWPHAP